MGTTTWFLIDNDEDDREIFEMALNMAAPDISLETAKSGSEALEKLKTSVVRPDLIFLDINMPWMSGFECLRRIKADTSLSILPVYMYSTSNDPRDREEAYSAGANGYICKPSDIEVLTLSLKKLAEKGTGT